MKVREEFHVISKGDKGLSFMQKPCKVLGSRLFVKACQILGKLLTMSNCRNMIGFNTCELITTFVHGDKQKEILRTIKAFPNPCKFQFFTGLVTLSKTISSRCFVRQKGKVVTQDYTSTSPSVIVKNLFHCNVESKMEIGKSWSINQRTG